MHLKIKKLPIVFLIFGVVFALLLTLSIFLFVKYQQATRTLSAIKQESVSELSGKVGRHVLLPSDEIPTVLTVTDTLKVSGQTFFAHASNGDKVLVYEKAKKAFLYSVSRDLVLEIGPVTFESTQSAQPGVLGQTAAISVAPQAYRFVLYNGTRTEGLTKSYETEVKTKIPAAVITDRDNAANQEYAATTLIDLGEQNATQAAVLAQTLGITVASLPDGETVPTGADFLIIVGSDQQ